MKKIFFSLVALVVVAAIAGGVWLYSSLDSLVQAAIEKYAPEITQTTVKVGRVRLSPADGTGVLSGLRIGNPKGFKTDHALKAGSIELGIDPASVARDVVLIRRIAVLAPDINYETSGAGSNFDVIQKNVESYVALSIGKSDPAAKGRQSGKKLIVESLSIRDAKVTYAPALLQGKTITLTLPDIEMRNLGKARGGVTSGELVAEIIGTLKARLVHAVSLPIKGATDSVVGATRGVGDKLKGLFK